jgi:capsular polysaccharide biosynthesis protein
VWLSHGFQEHVYDGPAARAVSGSDGAAIVGTRPAVVFWTISCECPAVSRLSDYLDRRLPSWRELRTLGDGIVGTVRRAEFAGLARRSRRSRTVAMRAESFAHYCVHLRPARVASAEALLAEPLRAPRVWTCAAPASVNAHSRIITIEGVRQPPFASAPPTYPSTQQAYLRVRSAAVYPRPGLVVAEPGVALRNNLLRWYPDHRLTPGFVDFVDGKLVAHADELRPRRHVGRTVLVLCHAFHRNYGVWLLDCLPFLLPWRGLLQQGRLAVLVPALSSWQRRTLELLGAPASAVIEAPELSVLCDDMIIPGLNSLGVEPAIGPKSYDLRQPGPAVIEAIQVLRAGILPTAAADRPECVYISRRGTESFRHLRNEDEVEAVMMRLGFAVLRTEDLSFDEQVATFARARVIAGSHGAGLNNAVFAPAGCLVVDICADSWPNPWFVRLTQLFEHNYFPVTFPSDAKLSQPIFLGKTAIGHSHVYTVQTDTLITVLESAMRRLGIERYGNRG